MDWIRSWIFTGFPWGLFPSSQWQHPLLFQICEYTGIYGLDFLLIFANFAIFFLLFEIRNTAGSKKIRISPVPVVFLLLLLLNILAGTYLMERQKEKNLKEPHTIFHAGIVQPHGTDEETHGQQSGISGSASGLFGSDQRSSPAGQPHQASGCHLAGILGPDNLLREFP